VGSLIENDGTEVVMVYIMVQLRTMFVIAMEPRRCARMQLIYTPYYGIHLHCFGSVFLSLLRLAAA